MSSFFLDNKKWLLTIVLSYFMSTILFCICTVTDTHGIYQKIIRTIGDRKLSPALEIVPTEEATNFASYLPEYNVIEISEALIDFVNQFESEASEAMALILAHELAHHYENHGQFRNILSKTNEENKLDKSYEVAADYFAIFFATIAGYPTASIEEKLLTQLYTQFEIEQNETKHYPSLEERLKIYKTARLELKDLLAVFEFGNRMLLLEQWPIAAHCYEYILAQQSSPEIFNNTGVAYFQAAYHLLPISKKQMIFPIAFNEKSKLNNKQNTRSNDLDDEIQLVLLKRYLQQAAFYFKQALLLDEADDLARINLISTYILQEFCFSKKEKELIHLKMQNELNLLRLLLDNSSPKGIIEILKGIQSFYQKEEQQAKTYFQKAMELDSNPLAQLNLKRIENPFNNNKNTIGNICKYPEKLDGIALVLPEGREMFLDKMSNAPAIIIAGYTYNLKLFQHQWNEVKAFYIVYSSMETGQIDYQNIYLLETDNNNNTKTCVGIGIGDDASIIEKRFGRLPDQFLLSREREYYRYKKSSLLVVIKNQIVDSIINYYIE